jgi:hypothetical protein
MASAARSWKCAQVTHDPRPAIEQSTATTSRPLIVVALDDSTERDRLSLVIEHARPQYDVLQIAADGLDALVLASQPQFVICSNVSATVEAQVPLILILDVQPPGAPRCALLAHHGVPRLVNGPSIGETLQLLDEFLSNPPHADDRPSGD